MSNATMGDLLRQLFKGYSKRDDGMFRAAALALVNEERAKNHRLLADDLEKIILNGNGLSSGRRGALYDVPKDRERGFPLVDIADFSLDWENIVLHPRQEKVLKQIAREYNRRDLLAAAGLRPKHRVLFYGPPGCGKTLAAKVLASIIGYPLVTVRFDAVVSSYLGETAANLRRVFEFIQRGNWVVLFDEFDAIGKERDNPFEHGELKRVVNTLLQLMDAFHEDNLLIAATNHEQLIDNALWRRFEAIISFTLPSPQERITLLRMFLKGFDCSKIDFEALGRRLQGASGSDIEWIAIEATRLATLDGRLLILPEDIEQVKDAYKERQLAIKRINKETTADST